MSLIEVLKMHRINETLVACVKNVMKSWTITLHFEADRLQMIVVAKKYICVATVHQ